MSFATRCRRFLAAVKGRRYERAMNADWERITSRVFEDRQPRTQGCVRSCTRPEPGWRYRATQEPSRRDQPRALESRSGRPPRNPRRSR